MRIPLANVPRTRPGRFYHPRMSIGAKAVLEGGPQDLPARIVPITPPGFELKIPFKGGYEHFKTTGREQDTPEGRLPVYAWSDRTEIAE